MDLIKPSRKKLLGDTGEHDDKMISLYYSLFNLPAK